MTSRGSPGTIPSQTRAPRGTLAAGRRLGAPYFGREPGAAARLDSASGERPVSLVVDRYELGPVGTNCYVVRASQAADEAVVVDPGGNAAELRLELARLGARCVAILITHGHWDHLGGVAELAEGTGAPVYMAEDERALLENLPDLVPPGVPARGYTADTS